ncbi:MAG: hypothetical protein JNM20_20160, partial [Rhizobiales bacterium]|nr:hypothetical protein [Hyphomicrobiales bacterium]
LPPAVASFATQFDGECKQKGLGAVVASENFRIDEDLDLNGDGKTDYLLYKCMFGCAGDLSALTGRLTPCPWGTLLLSEAGGYKRIFLPGMVNHIQSAPTVRAVISPPRILRLVGNYCADPRATFDPQYVYELKAGRFERIAMCPESGCKELLK